MFCEVCGADNVAKGKFCRRCGGKLSPPSPCDPHAIVVSEATDTPGVPPSSCLDDTRASLMPGKSASMVETRSPARFDSPTILPASLQVGTGWFLELPSGPDAGPRLPIRPSTRLGRSADNDVCADQADVSRHHAVIEVQGEACLIRDLASSAGTWVNGSRLSSDAERLYDGDMIGLSTYQFVVRGAPRPPGVPAPPPLSREQAMAPAPPAVLRAQDTVPPPSATPRVLQSASNDSMATPPRSPALRQIAGSPVPSSAPVARLCTVCQTALPPEGGFCDCCGAKNAPSSSAWGAPWGGCWAPACAFVAVKCKPLFSVVFQKRRRRMCVPLPMACIGTWAYC